MQRAITHFNIKQKYGVHKIIEIIKVNKDKHQAEFADATVEYAKQKVQFLKDADKAWRRYVKTTDPEDVMTFNRIINKLHSLREPINESTNYDKLVQIFESMSPNEPEVELEWTDATQIINDEYDWAVAAKTTNTFYASAAR